MYLMLVCVAVAISTNYRLKSLEFSYRDDDLPKAFAIFAFLCDRSLYVGFHSQLLYPASIYSSEI